MDRAALAGFLAPGLRREEVAALAAMSVDYYTRLEQQRGPQPSEVAPALLRVLDRLEDTPALILSSLGETLVQNRMAAALFGDRTGYTGRLEDHKTLVHPELGPIELDCQALFTEDQSQALLVLTAPPRSEGYEKLQLLAMLGQQRFAGAGPPS